MSAFTGELWGGISAPEAEFQNTYAVQQYTLGTKLKYKDGREFRFVKNGAVTAAVGKLYQARTPEANHVGIAVQAAAAADATSVSVTLGATAVTVNQYAEGLLVVEDADGQGHAYKIKSHPVHAGSGTLVVTLYPESKLVTALTTSSVVSLIHPLWHGVIIHPSPPTAPLAGVARKAIAANEWGWVQTKGLCAVLSDGAVTAGKKVDASKDVDGAVALSILVEAAPNTLSDLPFVGVTLRDAATTNYATVNLNID